MRLLLKLKPEKFLPWYKVNKHTIQGTIYFLLDDTEFSHIHSQNKFKFFTYSDVFPPGDFYPNKEKTLIISSPDRRFIETLYDKINEVSHLYLSDTPFKISSMKIFNLKPTGKFETGSPVVIQVDNKKGIYFSFTKKGNIRFFLERLKDNALKKYNAYYEDELEMKEDLFDILQFRKEVAVNIKKQDKSFIIIGSVWSLLQKKIPRGYGKFYRFILDCGIGEKNSLGFGFLNVLKEAREHGYRRTD